MSPAKVDVHELIAWGLDDYSYRSTTGLEQQEFSKKIERARQRLSERECYSSFSALLTEETESISHLLTASAQRTDLQEEYEGLDWTLGVVDLRHLLAFQRRLVFSPAQHSSPIPRQNNWPELIALAMRSRRGTEHRFVRNRDATGDLDISLHSSNPDLQVRLNQKTEYGGASPLTLHGGSPFIEVAELHGRWFLRDGYHRAYCLLQAGVNHIPAVVIYARSIEELGAIEPWFFNEDQLFSDHPPRVVDFLDEAMVLRYERTALRKIIRIRIEESLEPVDETEGVQGEKV